jgi:hypothetical protein
MLSLCHILWIGAEVVMEPKVRGSGVHQVRTAKQPDAAVQVEDVRSGGVVPETAD